MHAVALSADWDVGGPTGTLIGHCHLSSDPPGMVRGLPQSACLTRSRINSIHEGDPCTHVSALPATEPVCLVSTGCLLLSLGAPLLPVSKAQQCTEHHLNAAPYHDTSAFRSVWGGDPFTLIFGSV